MFEKIKLLFIDISVCFEQYRVLKIMLEAEKEEYKFISDFDTSEQREEILQAVQKEIEKYEDYIIAFRLMFLYHLFSIFIKTYVIYLVFVFISKIL